MKAILTRLLLILVLLPIQVYGSVRLISQSGGGEPANQPAYFTDISASGTVLAFESEADNLLPINPGYHVYVAILPAASLELASVNNSGAPADEQSVYPHVSANGRFVVFQSQATNLGLANPEGRFHAYARDLVIQRTIVLSVLPDGYVWGPIGVFNSFVTDDGRLTAYSAVAALPGDPALSSVFLRDVQSNRRSFVAQGAAVGLTRNGELVAFSSTRSLVAEDNNDLVDCYLFRVDTSEFILVSANLNGEVGAGESRCESLSPSGNIAIYSTNASNLVSPQYLAPEALVYKNLLSGESTALNSTPDGSTIFVDPIVSLADVSSDGRHVAFNAYGGSADLSEQNVAGKIFLNLYIKDMSTGELTEVIGVDGELPDDNIFHPSIADGGTVSGFSSTAFNLTNQALPGYHQAFVFLTGDNPPKIPTLGGLATVILLLLTLLIGLSTSRPKSGVGLIQ